MKFLDTAGAGYSVNKKAWQEASKKGLEQRIIERLKIFDRPTPAALLISRVCMSGTVAYTESEVRGALKELCERGIISENDGSFTYKA